MSRDPREDDGSLRARGRSHIAEKMRMRRLAAWVAVGAPTLGLASMASCAAYPIGVAGQAWGATERAQWLASRTIERSYREEVLLKLEGL